MIASFISKKVFTPLILALAFLILAPSSAKAWGYRVDLTGYHSFWRSGYSSYYYAAYMNGRYSRMGSGRYWRSGNYYSQRITHNRYTGWSRTGYLSHEFWGFPYYNGTRGYVLRTRGLGGLYAGQYYYGVRSSGALRQIRRYLFPKTYIAGKVNSGWWFLDRHSFSRSGWF